jgi:Mrp family chromosome partitioning ATPase
MEKLERALEKARAQRVDALRAPARPTLVATPEQAAAAEAEKAEGIVYQQTRTVRPDRSALLANRIVAADGHEAGAQMFRVLRTKILQQMARAGQKTLGITSANPGDGKTFVAVNLAIALSLDQKQTVLLVDLNLKNPSVHQQFGITPQLGLDDHLKDGTPISQCLVQPGFERLVLLPSRSPMQGSSEFLGAPRMAALARELRDRYPDRIVVYDMPPIFGSDDTLVFLPNVEASLLVVREGETSADDLARATEYLAETTTLIGSVLNSAGHRDAA